MAAICALIAAAVGFFAGIFLCQRFLTGELTEWALIAGPLTALIFGATVFILVLRWTIRYGEPQSPEESPKS
jgi:hypothetical protein